MASSKASTTTTGTSRTSTRKPAAGTRRATPSKRATTAPKVTGSNPFNKTRFLYWMLGTVFAWQLIMLSIAGGLCMINGTKPECADLNKRYESAFALVISTVLALLAPAPLK